MENPHSFIVALKAIVECECRCLGMTAENKQREHNNQAMAYSDKDFEDQISMMNHCFDQCRDWLK